MSLKIKNIILLLVVCLLSVQAQTDDVFNYDIQLTRQKGTTYGILNHISDISGFMFMYDSKEISSNRTIKIPAGTYSLKEAIILATGDKNINTKIYGNHILIYKETQPQVSSQAPHLTSHLQPLTSIEGVVKERETGEPIPFSTIGIYETGIGTVANQDGKFLFKIPDSLKNRYIYFSHLGYKTQIIHASLLAENKTDIFLETHYIPLETVIIRFINPQKLLNDMLDAINNNYYDKSHYLTTFYREGISGKRGFINLTEGIFQLFKTGYNNQNSDQLKMIKMRIISNQQKKDSVNIKFKAGLEACLTLDIIKNLPDFLTFDNNNMYHYANTGKIMIDERLAHVISFEQKSDIKWPLYKGELFIDSENYALLYAHFQIHPDFISQSASTFVVKKSRNSEIIPQKASYSVSYKYLNGKYFINHIRGDLTFNIKKKKFLGNYTTVNTWFEMVTCNIDLLNVKRFSISEIQSTKTILSEAKNAYDDKFWKNFNFIPPEEKLGDAILRINSIIEEMKMNE